LLTHTLYAYTFICQGSEVERKPLKKTIIRILLFAHNINA
jgi:hypothetical protein